jgi:hypothetical protein
VDAADSLGETLEFGEHEVAVACGRARRASALGERQDTNLGPGAPRRACAVSTR